jgi:hypothetical protein
MRVRLTLKFDEVPPMDLVKDIEYEYDCQVLVYEEKYGEERWETA